MDTWSTSVSTLKVPGLTSATPRELLLFKPPHTSNLPSQSNLSTSKPNSISNKSSSSFTSKNYTSPFLHSSQSLSLKSPSPLIHRNAASGYAAALLDIARCNNSLDDIERDVQRFSRLLRTEDLRGVLLDPFMDSKTKGEVVKQVAEKGRFHKHLVVLLKMLVNKNKVGMVGEVLEEFERIYDELCGTRVVLVSSARKMEEDQLFGIARRVQKLSGAMKVKVRHMIDQSLPSFAM